MRRSLEVLLFALAPAVAVAVSPMLARGLGVEARGDLALILAVATFSVLFGAAGQPEVLLADLRRGRLTARVRSRYVLVLVCSVAVAGVSAAILLALGVGAQVAVLACVAIPLLSVAQLWWAEAVARGMTLQLALQNGLPALLRALVITGLFLLSALTLENTVALTQAALALGAVLLFAVLRRRSTAEPLPAAGDGSDDDGSGEERWSGALGMLRQGLPVLVVVACTALLHRADIFVLGGFSSKEQLGLYATVLAGADAAFAVSAAFKNRVQAAAFAANAPTAVAREMSVMLGVLGLGVAVGQLFAEEIVVGLFGPDFASAVPAFRILLIAAVFLALLDCGQGLLAVLGLRSAMLVSGIVGAVLAIGTALLLVPGGGAAGAAISSLISYVGVAFSSWRYVVLKLRDELRQREGIEGHR